MLFHNNCTRSERINENNFGNACELEEKEVVIIKGHCTVLAAFIFLVQLLSMWKSFTLNQHRFQRFYYLFSPTITTFELSLHNLSFTPTPYFNLTASFLCFQLQFVSIAPSPRWVCSGNSSPRHTWCHAPGCCRK